jgi:hypothetical protein
MRGGQLETEKVVLLGKLAEKVLFSWFSGRFASSAEHNSGWKFDEDEQIEI